MKYVSPSINEVYNSLRASGCCWLGGKGCECYSRQLKQCYQAEEKRLTKTVYTDDEIKQMQIENQKAMAEINEAINAAFND